MNSEQWERMLGEDVLGYAQVHLNELLGRCESPIERVLLLAILRQFGVWPDIGPANIGTAPWRPPEVTSGMVFVALNMRNADRARIQIFPQLELRLGSLNVRLDIAILDVGTEGVNQKIAVECDGHDFHERTKQQASRDKARDRAMQAAGWKVLRFTGSDIIGDPCGRAEEVLAFLKKVPA